MDGLVVDEPLVLINLIDSHSVLTWQPPGCRRPETWVECQGRLLSHTPVRKGEDVREQHARIVGRLVDLLSHNNLYLTGWLRQGIEAGLLKPGPYLTLAPQAQTEWDLLGGELTLAHAEQDRLPLVQVTGLNEFGVLVKDSLEEPWDQVGGQAGGCGGRGAVVPRPPVDQEVGLRELPDLDPHD